MMANRFYILGLSHEPHDSANAAPQRRYAELWRELVFARLGVSLAVFLFTLFSMDGIFWSLRLVGGRWIFLGFIAALALTVSLPSQAARRSWAVIPTVSCAVAVAIGIPWIVCILGLTETLPPRVILGAVGAGIGWAEGFIERSLATIHAGLMGGAVFGFMAGALVERVWLHQIQELDDLAFPCAIAVCFIHVAVGLSLALGRWIGGVGGERTAR
jgi:hypothetical protein